MSQDNIIQLNPNKSVLDTDDLDTIVAEVIDYIGEVADNRNLPLNDEFARDMAIAMRFVRAGFSRQMGAETDVIQEEMTKLADFMLK
jgi:hypothetical protein